MMVLVSKRVDLGLESWPVLNGVAVSPGGSSPQFQNDPGCGLVPGGPGGSSAFHQLWLVCSFLDRADHITVIHALIPSEWDLAMHSE